MNDYEENAYSEPEDEVDLDSEWCDECKSVNPEPEDTYYLYGDTPDEVYRLCGSCYNNYNVSENGLPELSDREPGIFTKLLEKVPDSDNPGPVINSLKDRYPLKMLVLNDQKVVPVKQASISPEKWSDLFDKSE